LWNVIRQSSEKRLAGLGSGLATAGCAYLIAQGSRDVLQAVHALIDLDDTRPMLFAPISRGANTSRATPPQVGARGRRFAVNLGSAQGRTAMDSKHHKLQRGRYVANRIVIGILQGDNADARHLVGGKVHIFAGERSRGGVYLDPPRNIALVNRYRKAEVAKPTSA
jgi:hypothetical protein